ncbi:aspartate carbamoyltransferase catalytic subunit [Listeria booriae]|uniref:aspartate carbamoyltransferase catalytic subunit n=1 Tax=Listeria booriae TaxID=1552123 RepID=UPI001628C454|nr:aspartate carbamoyltransferase catalytic subunit [Listeria booriae]MBC2323745.1 aspartate carbamoyltransferase catalytic subunit [Listeria booriae]MCD2207180.1 aspartate carbamoyltransferase catalytic subunit [Listeria booriae]
MKDVVSMEELSVAEIGELLDRAGRFKQGEIWTPKKQMYAVNMFFEASTRTHNSFEMAQKKLGIEVLSFDPSKSSVTKGETLYDTALTMQAIGVDVAVIRHSDEDYYEPLRELGIAIVNGGDGCGQHPSQSLLDLFTIKEEFGGFKGLKVAIVGDIVHSRVANSNMQALKRLGAEVFFAGPPEWLREGCDEFGTYMEMDDLVEQMDVIMLLRVQEERHDGLLSFTKSDYHEKYGLTEARAAKMKDNAIIMHPSPVNRDVEIADSLVECEKSRIVEQMTNGVFIRMAILEAVCQDKETRVKTCTY